MNDFSSSKLLFKLSSKSSGMAEEAINMSNSFVNQTASYVLEWNIHWREIFIRQRNVWPIGKKIIYTVLE